MKTVRILLNIGTTDQRRLQLDRLYTENEIVDLEDEQADILIKEGKAWETSSEHERRFTDLRERDIRSQALAAAEREVALDEAKKEAQETVRRARTAAANAPRGTTQTPPAKPVSSRELGTAPHDQPLTGKATAYEATPSTMGMNPHTDTQVTKKP